jgi:hypothetical protein
LFDSTVSAMKISAESAGDVGSAALERPAAQAELVVGVDSAAPVG